jgi:hypothetical protein
VIPTTEHVEMRFGRSGVEFLGFGATVLAIGAIASVRLVPAVRRRWDLQGGSEEAVQADVTV